MLGVGYLCDILFELNMKFLYSILLINTLLTSCRGQVNTQSSKDTTEKFKTTLETQPKMVRSQGVMYGNVECELQDKEGNLWFSTSGEGAYCYDGKSFTNFTTRDGLLSNDVGPIIQDKEGNILLGTNKGICIYNGKSFNKYPGLDTLGELGITCLLEDMNGSIWFGTMSKGIYNYDGKNLRNFLHGDNQTFNLGSHDQLIINILEDSKGNIWFCSWNGGGVWKYDGLGFTNYLPAKEYYTANEDGRNLNATSNKFLNYQPKDNLHISDDMVFCVAEDKLGNLWFGTRRHGVCVYNGKTFTVFGEQEGFVSYGINAILEDKKGNIWFGSDKNGAFCYNGKTFKNFTTHDGLINNSVRSILEDTDGNLWFGTRGFGLSRYNGLIFEDFAERVSQE
jgi:ligand-binding sensor domain-containing protein